MKVEISRDEPTTGGSQRTPRERIEPVFSATDEVEPDALLDASTSEGWEVAAGSSVTRWTVQMGAFKKFVAVAESLDSQAATEQAGGSTEEGGIYTAFFNHGLVEVGTGGDDGDLNSANFDRKVSAIVVSDEHGRQVPLPYGGTAIMPSCRYLDKHYLSEFGDRPVTGRPLRARLVFTDGELKDAHEFGQRLAEDNSSQWPGEQWFIAIVGYGKEHDDTLRQYQEIAETHKHVHIYSFEEVTSSAEIAEDMAIAVLATK